jgi:raffinose/stachyose/melibiose transport system substrate-binding protein
MTRRLALIATGLVAALIASACAPGSDSDDEDDGDGSAEVNTDPASLGDVTLTVWDQEVRGGQAAQIEALNAAFQEAYPNITIDRVSHSFEDFLATLRLAITDEEPPALPVVILYLFLQRHFIQGIVEGSTRG